MKKVICFFICVCFMMHSVVVFAEGNTDLGLNAKSAILMEEATGNILYESNPDERLPIASVTKVMTMLLIMEAVDSGKISLDDMVTVSENAMSYGGSTMFLETGEQLTVNDMLKGIAVASANDGCVAMAEHLAGTEQTFVEQMNQRAEKLGMKNTHFVDCCGLTESKDHYTTPYDIALMSRELISRYPEVLTYSSVWMEDITHVTRKGSFKFTLTNTNKLLRSYEGCMGLKTGSTSIAKYCLSAVAKRNGITLIASVMAAPDPKTRFRDAAALLNYGFSKCILYTDDVPEKLKPLKIRKGVKQEASLVYKGKFRYLSTDGTKPDHVKKKVVLPEEQTAPVKKGEKAGKQEYYQNGKKIGSIDILYGETVQKADYHDWLKCAAWEYLL